MLTVQVESTWIHSPSSPTRSCWATFLIDLHLEQICTLTIEGQLLLMVDDKYVSFSGAHGLQMAYLSHAGMCHHAMLHILVVTMPTMLFRALQYLNNLVTYASLIQKVFNRSKLQNPPICLPGKQRKSCKANGKTHPIGLLKGCEILMPVSAMKFLAMRMLHGTGAWDSVIGPRWEVDKFENYYFRVHWLSEPFVQVLNINLSPLKKVFFFTGRIFPVRKFKTWGPTLPDGPWLPVDGNGCPWMLQLRTFKGDVFFLPIKKCDSQLMVVLKWWTFFNTTILVGRCLIHIVAKWWY